MKSHLLFVITRHLKHGISCNYLCACVQFLSLSCSKISHVQLDMYLLTLPQSIFAPILVKIIKLNFLPQNTIFFKLNIICSALGLIVAKYTK